MKMMIRQIGAHTDEDDYEEEYGFRRKKRSHEAPSDDTAGERDERFQYLSCPAGKVFCLESNRCSDECGGGQNELDISIGGFI